MIQKVLVIDDSMVSREIMRNYLEDASVDVTAYDSGKKAVELLQSERNCEYDVAGVVLLHVNTVFFSPAQEIVLNLAFVL